MALSIIPYNTNFGAVSATTLTGQTSYTINNGQVALIFVTVPKSTTITLTDTAGHTYTFIDGITNNASSPVRVEAWYYINTSGTSINTAPKLLLGSASKAVLTVAMITGADTSAPIGATSTNPNGDAKSTSPTASLNLNAANSYLFAGYGTNGAPTFTVSSTDTRVTTTATSGGSASTNTRGAMVFDNTITGSAGQTLTTAGTWSASSFWASVGVEIKLAPTGGGLQTLTKSHLTDAFKYASPTPNHTTDTLIRAVVTKTHTADAFLLRTPVVAHATDSLKKAVVSLTTSTNALKRLVVAPNHTTSSYILRVPTLPHTTDTIKRSSIAKTHTTNAFAHIEATKTHTADSNLSNALQTLSLDSSTDAVLRSPQIVTHGTYATLKTIKQVLDTTDALLRSVITTTHTTDVLPRSEVAKSFTTDTLLRAGVSNTHTTDSLLLKPISAAHTTDSYALRLNVVLTQHTTDALLGATVYGDWSDTWDGTVQNFFASHTTSSETRGLISITHTTDSLLLFTTVRTHTVDALLRKLTQVVHSVSAALGRVTTTSQTLDTLLREEDVIDHDTDAFTRREVAISHTTDSLIKQLTYILRHTTSSLLKARPLHDDNNNPHTTFTGEVAGTTGWTNGTNTPKTWTEQDHQAGDTWTDSGSGGTTWS